MKLPNQVNILGIEYSIQYVEKPSDVDIYKRETLWGQIDYWTRTIRIYKNERPIEDIFQSVIHEVLHGIAQLLHLDSLDAHDDQKHEDLEILAVALVDIFTRNGWLELEGE